MIRSHHKHLWGGAIDIGGTVYKVDANGYLQDAAPEVEAALLAQQGNWYSDKSIPKLGTPAVASTVAEPVPVPEPAKVKPADHAKQHKAKGPRA